MRVDRVLLALACIFAVILLSRVAPAQASSCLAEVTCANYSLYEACAPPLPPNAFDCGNDGPFEELCWVPTNSCSPSPCPTCNGAEAGGPIDLATGNTDIRQTDVRLPGLGGGLTLTRTWNSQSSRYGLFGKGWSSNLDERIDVGQDWLVKHSHGDGSIWSFGWSGYTSDGLGSTYLQAGPRNGSSSLQVNSAIWTFIQQTGDKKTFSRQTGSLLSIVDRNGNTTQFSYDASNHLTSVQDPASRHLYLTYTSYTVAGIEEDLVTSVTSDFGVSYSYHYDALGRLTQVTKPDGTFTTFEYNSGDYITAVKDSQGRVLESHTYDSLGRGLTSARANGVEAVTVSY